MQSIPYPSFTVNTNDLKTLQVNITINQDKKALDLTNATVTLAIKKPDNKTVFQDVTVVDALAGSCKLTLNTQAYVVPGFHKAEVMIYYGTDTVAVTSQFSYTANKGIMNDSSIESTNEFQAISKVVSDAVSIKTEAQQSATASAASATAAQVLIDEAKGTYPNLSTRLTANETSLAQSTSEITNLQVAKADKVYVDTLTQSLASGSPKGTYATLAALQTAYPTGTTGIYVVVADGKWYYWSGSAWAIGGTYQSQGIVDRTVPIDKLDFVLRSTNLIDETKSTTGFRINATTGLTVADAAYMVSDYTYIKPNTIHSKYYVDSAGIVTAVQHDIAFYDASKNYISGIAFGTGAQTFTTPTNAQYIRVNYGTGGAGKIMLIEGNTPPTKYEAYFARIGIDDSVQSTSRTWSSNKILRTNLDTSNLGVLKCFLNGTVNNAIGSTPADTYSSTSNRAFLQSKYMIPVPSSTSKIITRNLSVDYLVGIHQYDSNNIMISDSGWVNPNTLTTLTKQPTCAKIRIYFNYFLDTSKTLDLTRFPVGLFKVTFDDIDNRNELDYLKKSYYDDIEKRVSAVEIIPTNVIKNPLDANVKAIMHRGYNFDAPEETLPAYQRAKDLGFSYVECDVQFSSDGYPVLIHDSDVGRTSNGSGYVKDLTLAQLKALDFGVKKNVSFTGTQILTFQEFLIICKKLNLYAYVEPKITDTTQIQNLVDIARKMGMLRKITWEGYNITLNAVLQKDPKARCAYQYNISDSTIQEVLNYKTTYPNADLYMSADYTTVTQALADQCLMEGLSLEVFTCDDDTAIITLAGYGVTGIITNYKNVAQILQNSL
jgi:glycerophosphoryl diester phosphodiesterase